MAVVLWGPVEPSLEVPPLGTAKHRPHLLRNKVDMLLLSNSQFGLCVAVTSPELPVGKWVSCSVQGPHRMWPCNLPLQFGISYALVTEMPFEAGEGSYLGCGD